MSNISGFSLISSLVLSATQIEKTVITPDPATSKAVTNEAEKARPAKPIAQDDNILTIPAKKRGDHDILA